MSSDPYAKLPNLTGQTAPGLDQTRGADPQRVYPPAAGGVIDPIVGRVLDVPRVALMRRATLTVPDSTAVDIPWDTVEYDTDGMFSFTNQVIITAKTPGLYMVCASIGYGASGAGVRELYFRRNGIGSYGPMLNGPNVYTSTCALIPLNAGDTVDVVTVQSSGLPLGTTAYVLPDHLTALQACLVSTFGSDNQ